MNVAIGLAAVIDFGANSPQYAQSVAAVPHGSFEARVTDVALYTNDS